jgi:hypothetical protein
MPQWEVASVPGVMSLAALWSICSSLSPRVTRTSEYEADRDPLGFFMVALGKFLASCFCFSIVLHAVRLFANDPIAEIKRVFPWLPGSRKRPSRQVGDGRPRGMTPRKRDDHSCGTAQASCS